MTREHDLAVIGAGLLDAGYATTDAGAVVQRIAALDGPVTVGMLPSAVIIDAPDAPRPALVATTGAPLTFAQVGRIAGAAAEAERGAALSATADAIAYETGHPGGVPWWRAAVGGALMSGGIAVVFGLPWWALVPDALLGAVVAVLLMATGRVPGLSAVFPFAAALLSAVVIGLIAAATGQEALPVFAVCAPIVMLIPGATVTNAVLEITGGDVVSGGGRLLSGLLIWGVLGAGVTAGLLLVQRLHPLTLAQTAADPVPAALAWPAVLLLGIGVAVFFSSPRMMALALTAGLLAAYALSAALTALIGSFPATTVTAAALLIALRSLEMVRSELPALATFRPTFWLLVPGSLGLASIAQGDGAGLMAVASTVVAIMLGVLVGSAVTVSTARHRGAQA